MVTRPRHSHQWDGEAFGMSQNGHEFGSLAGMRQGEDDIMRRDHSQIAVSRFGGMDKLCGRACG